MCAIGRSFDELYEPGDRWHRGGHHRLAPPNASSPKTGDIQVLEEARDGGWVFRYTRTDRVERRNVPVEGRPGWVHPVGEVPASRRASCRVMADDTWVLPYDLASVHDLRYYLASRENRGGYLSMVPVIRAALAAKEAEQAAEEPFRRLLADQIQLEHPDLDRTRVEALLVDAAHRWKLGNRHHRALAAGDARDLKAAAAIHTDVTLMLGARTVDTARVEMALATTRAVLGDDLLVLTSKRDGTLHAYASHAPTLGIGGGWLREVALGTSGRRAGVLREWQVVPAAAMSRRTVVWASPRWATFAPADPAKDITGPELDDGIETLRRHLSERDATPFAIAFRAKESPYGFDGHGLVGFALRPIAERKPAPDRSWSPRDDDLDTVVDRITLTACATPHRTRDALVWEMFERRRVGPTTQAPSAPARSNSVAPAPGSTRTTGTPPTRPGPNWSGTTKNQPATSPPSLRSTTRPTASVVRPPASDGPSSA